MRACPRCSSAHIKGVSARELAHTESMNRRTRVLSVRASFFGLYSRRRRRPLAAPKLPRTAGACIYAINRYFQQHAKIAMYIFAVSIVQSGKREGKLDRCYRANIVHRHSPVSDESGATHLENTNSNPVPSETGQTDRPCIQCTRRYFIVRSEKRYIFLNQSSHHDCDSFASRTSSV